MTARTISVCLIAALMLAITVPAYSQEQNLQDAIERYLRKQGPIDEKPKQVMADLDGDGRPEAIVTYCIDENLPGGKNQGANNPANAHCDLAVFKQIKSQWGVVGKMNMGQGKLREIKEGKIYVEALVFGPKDPLCCPSQTRVARLGLVNGKLSQIR